MQYTVIIIAEMTLHNLLLLQYTDKCMHSIVLGLGVG